MISAGERGKMVDWGVASSALGDGLVSGDMHVVAEYELGALVGVIDGLGHGAEAAIAARESADLLKVHASDGLVRLVERCHDALRKTRGAVMTLASFDAPGRRMSWVGIGNVEGILVRAGSAGRQGISTRGGVVGYKLPPLHVDEFSVAAGDTLVLATDGVRTGFADDVQILGDPRELATSILGNYGKGSDDALVLVARYTGGA
jgi:serine phosphatase RsbU (regulator of sigma subunit)